MEIIVNAGSFTPVAESQIIISFYETFGAKRELVTSRGRDRLLTDSACRDSRHSDSMTRLWGICFQVMCFFLTFLSKNETIRNILICGNIAHISLNSVLSDNLRGKCWKCLNETPDKTIVPLTDDVTLNVPFISVNFLLISIFRHHPEWSPMCIQQKENLFWQFRIPESHIKRPFLFLFLFLFLSSAFHRLN